MKRNLILVLALFLSAGVSSARLQTDNEINSIRQQYSAINKRAARLRKVKKPLSGYSLEGGDLLAYFDGPSILKIAVTHYGEMGRSAEEYYYKDGQLIFVFEKVFHYNRPMTGKVVRTAENRYYFKDDKLIRWIGEDGKQSDLASEDFLAKQKELLDSSNEFVTAAKSKSRIVEK